VQNPRKAKVNNGRIQGVVSGNNDHRLCCLLRVRVRIQREREEKGNKEAPELGKATMMMMMMRRLGGRHEDVVVQTKS
jgi:hypothetical protein